MRTCNQLSGLETRHRFAAARCMPDMSAPLSLGRIFFPIPLCYPIGNADCSVILITSHYLKQVVICISNRIESDQHMSHRNIQKPCRNLIPFIDKHIVKVRPMEKERWIENTILSRICKIDRFLRLHCNEYLYQRKDPPERTLMRILYDLVICIAYRNVASLKLDMDDRHTIDQEHQIPSSVIQNRRFRIEMRLLNNLVSALTISDFLTVINLQADFFSKVQFIIQIVSNNRYTPTVNKAVQLQRCPQIDDLFHDLLHLAIRQRTLIQTVSLSVVIEQNIRPVFK